MFCRHQSSTRLQYPSRSWQIQERELGQSSFLKKIGNKFSESTPFYLTCCFGPKFYFWGNIKWQKLLGYSWWRLFLFCWQDCLYLNHSNLIAGKKIIAHISISPELSVLVHDDWYCLGHCTFQWLSAEQPQWMEWAVQKWAKCPPFSHRMWEEAFP